MQAAIDKALTYLEGLTGYGNACTDAQLVTAYSALGIDCTGRQIQPEAARTR